MHSPTAPGKMEAPEATTIKPSAPGLGAPDAACGCAHRQLCHPVTRGHMLQLDDSGTCPSAVGTVGGDDCVAAAVLVRRWIFN
jgi:hypothetical protein